MQAMDWVALVTAVQRTACMMLQILLDALFKGSVRAASLGEACMLPHESSHAQFDNVTMHDMTA